MKSLTGGLVALAMLAALSAQAVEQGIAKVVNIRGAARYTTTENTNWRPLKTGTVLKQGTVIQTAAESYVDVVLNNPSATAAESVALSAADSTVSGGGPVGASYAQPKAEQDAVRIYENTVLGIDKLTVSQTGADKVTDTQLDLKAGRILGTVKKLSAASTYEIKIPNGVAGVRGTIYTVSADGILSVLSGSVVLSFVGSDGSPKVQEVKAGQQYDAKTGIISDIPESELKQRIKDAKALRIGPNTPPTTFTVDRTVYYVSPTLGQNGVGTPP
ncbi:MAG: FecR domain-containing protein [Akkermansiaceae bacterium]|nr:FecR domain-containing protein [Verrucomicrobiales bacterium]